MFAFEGENEIHRPTGMCTKDINSWGLPSVCFCQNGYHYDKRIGYCVPDHYQFPKITKQGKLFILNENKNKKQFILNTTETEGYKLVLNIKDQLSIMKYKNQIITIEGESFMFKQKEKKTKLIIVSKFIN